MNVGQFLGQMGPVHTLRSFTLLFVLILSYQLSANLPNRVCLFTSHFITFPYLPPCILHVSPIFSAFGVVIVNTLHKPLSHTVTVFTVLLGDGFQRWVHVLAGWRPCQHCVYRRVMASREITVALMRSSLLSSYRMPPRHSSLLLPVATRTA
jgi:hypothetical protein